MVQINIYQFVGNVIHRSLNINEKYLNESNLFKLITIARNEIVNVNKPIPPKRPDSINRYKNSL